MAESDEEEFYTVALKEASYFGAGIRKKGVKFVPASDPNAELTPTQPAKSFSERYLSIVMDEADAKAELPHADTKDTAEIRCEVCKLPVDPSNVAAHESSLAHQLSLQHIHPPSAVDRHRKGVSYLQSYGWDPDSRTGLGAAGEGILHPIRPQEKKDKVGVGASRSRSSTPGKQVQAKPEKLSGKALRKLEQEKKRRDQRLHDMFYTDERVARYLGPDA
jgi:hypothetical protein